MSDLSTPRDPAAPAGSTHEITYSGTVRQLLPIVIINIILNVITLTIYRFWARTRVRHYLWSHTRLDGEPLEYTGKGSEIFIGFILVIFLFFIPLSIGFYLAISVFGESNPVLSFIFIAAVYVLLLFLYGFAIYSARRYRLSRTQWRGIRMTQTGSARVYAAKLFGFMILTGVTLGWIQPLMDMRLWSYEMNNSWFGDEKFNFQGSSAPLYKVYAAVWFITVLLIVVWSSVAGVLFNLAGNEGSNLEALPEIGIIVTALALYLAFLISLILPWAWYYARFFKLAWQGTTIQNAGFNLRISAGALIGFNLGNLAILFLTLGIGLPFVQQRIFRFFIERTTIEGDIDFAAIGQSKEYVPRFGEGLAESFDLGTI